MPVMELDRRTLNAVYAPYLTDGRRYQIFFGGASSGKSHFIATRVMLDALQGRNTLVLRSVSKTICASCWNECNKAIARMGLAPYFAVSKTDFVITARNNGAQVLFSGLNDVEKIKSITPAAGVLTDVWIEEATEVSYEDFKQLDKRLRGVSRHKKRVTLSFNPVYKTHWIYREFFAGWTEGATRYADDTLSILKTTYKDNRFLSPDDRAAMERESDPYYREVYTLGNWGVLGDVVFRRWRAEDLRPLSDAYPARLYGLDFGFASDPCAAVNVALDRARRRVLVFDELYARGLTNAMLAEKLRAFCGRGYITCDSAEPKSIYELRNLGINALAAKKGADSVVHGIQWLQGHEVVVDVRCQALKNELTLYQWKKDRDGNSLSVPEDRNNHLIDALRYALESESTARYATISSKEAIGI